MNIIDDLQNDEPRRRIFNEIPKDMKVLNNIHLPEFFFFPSFKKKIIWKMNIIDDLQNNEK